MMLSSLSIAASVAFALALVVKGRARAISGLIAAATLIALAATRTRFELDVLPAVYATQRLRGLWLERAHEALASGCMLALAASVSSLASPEDDGAARLGFGLAFALVAASVWMAAR